MSRISILLITSLSLYNLSSLPSLAQAGHQIKLPPTKTGKSKGPPRARKVFGKEPTISDLPKFPGATFISCKEVKRTKEKNGDPTAYEIMYSIPKNSESQVAPFYANAFSGGGWRINQKTVRSVDATNDSTYCECNASVNSFDQFTSTLEVNYVVGQQPVPKTGP